MNPLLLGYFALKTMNDVSKALNDDGNDSDEEFSLFGSIFSDDEEDE